MASMATRTKSVLTRGTSNKWQFSEEEIRAKLEELGYNNIPNKALKEFSNDLHNLISSENTQAIDHHQDRTLSSSRAYNNSATVASPSASDQSVSYHDGQESVSYKTSIHVPTAYNIDESSFEKSPAAYHNKPCSYEAVTNKENQVESKHPVPSMRMMQKRKVLRKKNGEALVFDESFTQEAATDISDVEKRLQKLPLKEESDSENIDDDDVSDVSSVLQPWAKNRNALPSFIRPRTTDTRGIRKTDPVSRYHQFKQEWASNKVPGEKTHKSLRWSTREQMLQHESFEKPRHSYVPNNYVAPTQKKRQALRWEVRSTLANR